MAKPYGENHNDRMDYIATISNFNDTTRRALFNYGNTYSDPNFTLNTGVSLAEWNAHLSELDSAFYLVENPTLASQFLVDNGHISSGLMPLVDSLSLILANAANYSLETYMTPNQFDARIALLEDYIVKNETVVYNSTTKMGNGPAMILAACSIAKHSYRYWLDAESNSSHPWYNRMDKITYMAGETFNPNEIETRICWKCIWKAIKVAATDAYGFVAAEGCGNAASGGYDLGCAWDQAGKKSSNVP